LRGLAPIAALSTALLMTPSLASTANASQGVLTRARVGQDHMHGWVAGSVTWDQCPERCSWEMEVIVKPADEPCTVEDMVVAGGLEDGKASGPIYVVWSDGFYSENRTKEVGGYGGFPAVIGQQACLDVRYTPTPREPRCVEGMEEDQCGVVLAALAFSNEWEGTTSPPPPTAPPATSPPATSPTSVTQPAAASPRHPLTRAQRLRKALALCRKTFHRRHRRAACERHAHARYKPPHH
jgi:hypothetical protein